MSQKLVIHRTIIAFARRSYSTDRNYSTALGVLPGTYEDDIYTDKNEADAKALLKPYSQIPGPRELPIIGNAWRFAPIIGKPTIFMHCFYILYIKNTQLMLFFNYQ